MTQRLKMAIDQASQLPPDEQDALATWLLEEMDSERRWDEAFQASADRLKQLAEEALQAAREERTGEIDPDRL